MPDEILRVKNISKSFSGVTALDRVSLEVNKGEILCLVGENGSGKSTLIKIISGVYKPDEGDIFINQNHYKNLTPIESIREGVQVIYQDFSLFPNLTVVENLAINEQLSSGKQFVNWKEFYRIAAKGLSEIGVSIPLDEMVGSLSTADRQLIAITKAIQAEAKIIIMDEPTTALTQNEIKSLFKIIHDLKDRNISTLFVSHKLNEITEISERVVVLRNGKKVVDLDSKSIDIKSMEYYMTGRKLDRRDIKSLTNKDKNKSILEVRGLALRNKFEDINFDLFSGEVLGITGLLGCGRTELALSLFGEMPADSGSIKIDGKEVKIRSIRDAVNLKIGYVPEDRIREGLFMDRTISENIAVPTIHHLLTPLRLIKNSAIIKLAENWIKRLEIKTPSGENPAKSLSGGNQQRIVLAKWLASKPRILILNSPTVGVDVGSKVDIHKLIRELADNGIGILMISDDIPELMRTCDRIILMKNGRISEEFRHDEIHEEQLNDAMIKANI